MYEIDLKKDPPNEGHLYKRNLVLPQTNCGN